MSRRKIPLDFRLLTPSRVSLISFAQFTSHKIFTACFRFHLSLTIFMLCLSLNHFSFHPITFHVRRNIEFHCGRKIKFPFTNLSYRKLIRGSGVGCLRASCIGMWWVERRINWIISASLRLCRLINNSNPVARSLNFKAALSWHEKLSSKQTEENASENLRQI